MENDKRVKLKLEDWAVIDRNNLEDDEIDRYVYLRGGQRVEVIDKAGVRRMVSTEELRNVSSEEFMHGPPEMIGKVKCYGLKNRNILLKGLE